MQASVVVPIDPAGGRVLDVGEGLVRAVVEDGRGDGLGLEQTDDRSRDDAQRIVDSVARVSLRGLEEVVEPDDGEFGVGPRDGSLLAGGAQVC